MIPIILLDILWFSWVPAGKWQATIFSSSSFQFSIHNQPVNIYVAQLWCKEHHATKTYGGVGMKFHVYLPQRIAPWYPLHRRLDEPWKNESQQGGKENNYESNHCNPANRHHFPDWAVLTHQILLWITIMKYIKHSMLEWFVSSWLSVV